MHFCRVIKWLNAPNPESNHNTARLSHDEYGAETGGWLLQTPEYRVWKLLGFCQQTTNLYGRDDEGT